MDFREEVASQINLCIGLYNIESFVEAYIKDTPICENIICKNKGVIDKNRYVIELYKAAVGSDLAIDRITRTEYNECKAHYELKDNKYADWYTGFIGKICTKNRRWFGSYNSSCDEEITLFKKEMDSLIGTEFICEDYMEFTGGPKKSVIYVKPPAGKLSENYNICSSINSSSFWEHTRELSKKHIVFVHGTMCPVDFKEIICDNDSNEKLFIHESLSGIYTVNDYDF